MSDLWDRIEHILKANGWTERELARRAGLKSHTHVGLLKTVQRPTLDTVMKIAGGANVSLMWLITGQGSPDDVDVSPLDAYPNRGRAIAAARLLGFEEQDIAEVLATPGFKSDDDPPVDWWFGRITRTRDRRLGVAPQRHGVVARASPPPRAAKLESAKNKPQD